MQTLHALGAFQVAGLKPSDEAVFHLLRASGPLSAGEIDQALSARYVTSTCRAARRRLLEAGVIDRLGRRFVVKTSAPTASGSLPDRHKEAPTNRRFLPASSPEASKAAAGAARETKSDETNELRVEVERLRAEVLDLRRQLAARSSSTATPAHTNDRHACASARVSRDEPAETPELAEKLDRAVAEREAQMRDEKKAIRYPGAWKAKVRSLLRADAVALEGVLADARSRSEKLERARAPKAVETYQPKDDPGLAEYLLELERLDAKKTPADREREEREAKARDSERKERLARAFRRAVR